MFHVVKRPSDRGFRLIVDSVCVCMMKRCIRTVAICRTFEKKKNVWIMALGCHFTAANRMISIFRDHDFEYTGVCVYCFLFDMYI